MASGVVFCTLARESSLSLMIFSRRPRISINFMMSAFRESYSKKLRCPSMRMMCQPKGDFTGREISPGRME